LGCSTFQTEGLAPFTNHWIFSGIANQKYFALKAFWSGIGLNDLRRKPWQMDFSDFSQSERTGLGL